MIFNFIEEKKQITFKLTFNHLRYYVLNSYFVYVITLARNSRYEKCD